MTLRVTPRRATLTVLALVAAAGTATAAPAGADAVHKDKRVCAESNRAGYAACHAHVRTLDDGATPAATTSYVSGYAPAQLRTAYGVTGTSTTTVAVVDAYASPSALQDLNAYRAQFGLGAASLTQVNQSGVSALPAGDTGWGQEEALDLDMVSAICPGCKILYVGANSASFADLSTAVTTAYRLGATVISNSYGGSEYSGEVAASAAYNTPAANGVAVTVSSGDSGYGVQFPAAASGVVAVGGTHLVLNADGSRQSETVWSGAGSGCSAYVAKPTWQGDQGCGRRTVADVSAVADPNTGVAVYDSYGSTGGANWLVFGGTSVAAPVIGAVYAVSGVPGAGTYAAQNTYRSLGNSAALYDVTSGSNGSCATRKSTTKAYLCTGAVGYDGPTGVGTPVGATAF